ncbi:replication protein A [Glaciecola nitratireducens FR1064]|uniref:Replication protein A n=1 Tax=Glaciecola nitratireducens (strain JCM 12485 / KCTC 12276 / FR1064) TaxID=1085623 RepID=G4QG12_GLANF|nr:replication protein A [Glaciecola nitratireducens FR1064]
MRELISHLPRAIQSYLISDYNAKNTRFEANTCIRTTTEEINKIIPKVLLKHFDAGEEDLRLLAKDCAESCHYLLRQTIHYKAFTFVTKKETDVSAALRIDSCESEFLFSDSSVNASTRSDTIVLSYEKCANFVRGNGITPPKPSKKLTFDGCLKRMLDEVWWLRKLRCVLRRSTEQVMIYLNKVNRVKGIYCSDWTAKNRRFQKSHQLESLKKILMTNELGEQFTLYDIYEKGVSNPINRRNELMTRMHGFEELSKEHGHLGIFVTLTCPSKYHRAYSRSGGENPKWNGATPHDSQQYLCTTWARIRAEFNRKNIRLYGLRVSEPQHDGTPHWHLMIFVEAHQLESCKVIIEQYSLEEDGDEPGAKENRVKFVDIDPKKGSATGYVAKYVSKNIDGANLDEGIYGENPIEGAERVEAWASCWGIRQFQQLGGVSVTVWREMRRLKKLFDKDEKLQQIHQSADQGKWGIFVTLMGGVFSKRKDQLVRPYYDFEVNKDTGAIKANLFDGIPIFKLKGIFYKGKEIITRVHQWRIEKIAAPFSSSLGVL